MSPAGTPCDPRRDQRDHGAFRTVTPRGTSWPKCTVGSTYADTTIRTMVTAPMCVNVPDNVAVTYP